MKLKVPPFLQSYPRYVSILVFAVLGICTPAWGDFTWEGVPSGYGLAWSDEFNGAAGSAPNAANWSYETGATGWGNNELENYTTNIANAQVIKDTNATDGSSLGIIAIDTTPGNANYGTVGRYTSARLNTSAKKTFQYGYMVARVRMPYGQGIWPAYWMLGTNFPSVGWPACGEVDIMENFGNTAELPLNHGSLHDGIDFTNIWTSPSAPLHAEYHTYSALWVANSINFYVDGNNYFTVTSANQTTGTWAFNQAFYSLLNVAVGGGALGGTLPGTPDATTSFPQTMLVDYVRVYQSGLAAPAPVVSSTWRVNCGGDAYTDTQGNVWAADTNFSGGWSASGNAPLSGTSDPTLFEYERFGFGPNNATVPFTYTFNVPTGTTYQVDLKFMENYFTAAGGRKFNVVINGTTVLTNFDIFATSGGEYKAIDQYFNSIAPNASGQIVIAFNIGTADRPEVNAIQILPQAMAGTYTPTRSPTFTSTWTPTRTSTPTFTFTVPPTSTFTSSNTFTYTRTNTATNTPTPASTNTFTATSTFTRTNTSTGTSTYTMTNSPTATFTASNTFTSTRTSTPTNTNTIAPTNSFTSTATSTPTRTNTPSFTPSFTFTATSTSTNTPVLTSTFTATRTNTSSFTVTSTNSPTFTNSNTPAVTSTFTATSTSTFTRTSTFTFSATPTATGTSTFTRTNTPTVTNSSTSTPTNSFTATNTGTSTNTPVFSYTSTVTPTNTRTMTPTNTAIATATATFTHSPTITSTFTNTSTRTMTPTSTVTFTSTFSATFTSTTSSTNSMTSTSTGTPTSSSTATATRTFTATSTNTQSPTNSSTSTSTGTPTNSSTATATRTSTASFTATSTSTSTGTPTNTPVFSYTFTSTPTATLTFTRTNTSTFTSTPTFTQTATSTSTRTSTMTNTPVSTFTSTSTSTATSTSTYTLTPTSTPSFTFTPTSTFTPTFTHSHTFTFTPTSSSTATLTATPSVTFTPSPFPTFSPTPLTGVVLKGPYPNPSDGNPVNVLVEVSKPSTVEWSVFTMAFRKIRSGETQIAQQGTIQWDLRDGEGNPVADGLYYLRVQVDGTPATVKIFKVLVIR